MKNFKRIAAGALFAVSMVGATGASAAEWVQNGSFETNSGIGDPNAANWTIVGTPADAGITNVPVYAGGYALSIGDDEPLEYNQAVTTVNGQWYTFSYAYNGDGLTPNSFESYFGTQVAQSAFEVADSSGESSGWFTFSQTFQALSNSTLVRFIVSNSNENFGYVGLDAVSVTDASAPVPEIDAVAGTAAITLLLGTMGLVSGRHRRRS
ncbi:hypothetical protein [Methylomagnum sp.]